MLLDVVRVLLVREKWAGALPLLFWRILPALLLSTLLPAALLAGRRLRLPRRPPAVTAANATPLTDGQRHSMKIDYIETIDREAVCALASRHNGGLPCRLDEATPLIHGSFNACFFVEFHTTAERTQWVVRVPIEPIVHRTWEKVQSEVCTLQYVREHTTIPVPQVHAYGRAPLRHDESTDQTYYIIMERVHGQPLDILKLSKSPPETQRLFFADLIAIFAQLRRLDFDAAGSLMPGDEMGGLPMLSWFKALFSPRFPLSKPVIVNAISIPANELYIQGGRTVSPNPPPPPTSTTQFIDAGYHLLWDTYLMPLQDLSESDAQNEVFALQTLQQYPPRPQEHHNSQPEQFVLTHTDLRGPNIMVDHQFRIQAIIDWEWSVTVPAAFFSPPSWVITSENMLAEFHSALASLPSSHDPSVALLQKQWAPSNSDDGDLIQHMARIFETPYNLGDIFYKHIYPRLFTAPRKQTLRTFFLSPQWKEEIRRRVENSERYTQYLKANNLYGVNEEEQKQSELLAEAQAYLDYLNGNP